MNDLSVIDSFLSVFSSYIDSGFGLLSGDVAFLSTTMIVIDVTLAGLFWAFDNDAHVMLKLIRKILYVGAFAYILNNFQYLASVIYGSFAALGLKAGGGVLNASDLLKPGFIAATGYKAAHPMLEQAANLVGFPEIFSNALSVFVLLIAWLLVIISFFILSIQLFIAVLEFKLTSLAGFILVPFALWNKTSFLAERVLGNILSSGIKMMVLAIILGIGSTFFSSFTSVPSGQDFTLAMAMSTVLGSMAFLGLGIFGPAIASGLISGAPQLGAGAAIGTTGAALGTVGLAGAALWGGTRGSLAALRAGSALGAATATSYKLGQIASGSSSLGSGVAGVARAAGGAVTRTAKQIKDHALSPISSGAQAGSRYAWTVTGGSLSEKSPQKESAPMASNRGHFAASTAGHIVTQSIKDGDRSAHGDNPSLQQKD